MESPMPTPFTRRRIRLRRLVAAALVAAVFLLFGLLMRPWTKAIAHEERERKLLVEIAAPPSEDTLARQLSLLGLGGLRSLAAEILGLDAVNAWSRRDWNALEARYRQIVTLCPSHANYWVTGARHLAYNAAGDVLSNDDLPSWEQSLQARQWFRKGLRFLREGIAFNPENSMLYVRLGDFLSDLNRRPDFAASAAAYRRAVELGAPDLYRRWEFYSLCRTPGKEREAWALGRELFRDEKHRQPSLLCCLFALQNKLNLPEGERLSLTGLFGSEARARRLLGPYLHNTLRFPTDGVAAAIKRLDAHLGAPRKATPARATSS